MTIKRDSDSTNLEIEVKLKLDPQQIPKVHQTLLLLGFQLKNPNSLEHNIIYDTPDLSLKKKHHLLRLRCKDGRYILTFKRPAQDKQKSKGYKIREEIETGVSDYENIQTIITGLGYRPFFVYEKYRQVWQKENGPELMIDHTPIGYFMEIEGSEAQIDELAGKLGFSRDDYISSNYLTLFRKEFPEGDMVFEQTMNPVNRS